MVLVVVAMICFSLSLLRFLPRRRKQPMKKKRKDRFKPVHTYGKYVVYGGRDRDVEYLEFSNVLMLDWDVPDGKHPKECCTIRSRQEAYNFLSRFVKFRPWYAFRVYDTPGGVRAFLTSRCVTSPHQVVALMRRLHCDPLYVRLCQERKRFAVRVSPKVGRENDYVAKYVATIGKGKEDPDALEVVRYHDQRISTYTV